jgi:hypothetical protein
MKRDRWLVWLAQQYGWTYRDVSYAYRHVTRHNTDMVYQIIKKVDYDRGRGDPDPDWPDEFLRLEDAEPVS